MAKSLFDLSARQGATLTLLDIGGGFPGWDGSECVYHSQPQDLAEQATDAHVAAAASPTAAGLSFACHQNTASGDDGASRACCTAVEHGNGDAGRELHEGGEGIVAPPPPPLSLAEIARVTLPVLDALFPPSSGVQVTGLTQLRELYLPGSRCSAVFYQHV